MESEASHNNSELSSHSHCRFNARTVVLHSFCWDPDLPLLLIVSLTLCLFAFSVSRSLVFEGTSSVLPPNFVLRMIYPHNPQSRQLTRSIIVLRPHASGSCFPFLLFRGYFQRYAPCSPSRFCLYGRGFPHVCFARHSRVNNLFRIVNPGLLLFPNCLIVIWPLRTTESKRKTLE